MRSQEEIKEEARIHVDSVAVGLRELYAQASSAVTKLDTRVEQLEAKGLGGGPKPLLLPKHMTLSTLEKTDQWRGWKSDIEDYSEETLPGIKEHLDKAKENEEEIDEVDFDDKAWEMKDMLWRFLRHTLQEMLRRLFRA